MLARLLIFIACMAGMSALAVADDNFTLGGTTFSIPTGWSQIETADDHLTFGAADGRQRATISITHLGKAPSFDDFQLLCQNRYDAETNGKKDVVLIPKAPNPNNDNGQFIMHFTGEENPTGRVFSGLLWIKGNDLMTLYVEGIGVPADRNSDSFHTIVKSLR